MSKIRISLFHKTLVSVLLILLPVCFVLALNYYRGKEQMERLVLEDLAVMAEAYEAQVFQYLDMNKRRVEDFSSDGFIRSEFEKVRQGASPAALNNHLIRNKMPLDKSIDEIYLLTPSGIVAASTKTGALGADHSLKEYFRGGNILSVIYEKVEEEVEHVHIAVAIAVKGFKTGEPIGTMVIFFDTTVLDKLLTGEFNREKGALSWTKGRRKTMEAYIVDRNKLMMTRSRFLENAVLNQFVDTEPVRACLESSKEISGFYKDYRGVDIAGSSKCIPSLKWTILAEIDAAEALEGVSTIRRNSIIAGIVVACLILFFFSNYYRKVQALKKLSEASDRLAAGDFNTVIPVTTADEIGHLTESFNRMASELGEMTRELKDSEESLLAAQRIAGIGNWDWNIVKNTISWSDEIYRIFGTEPGRFEPTYENFLEFVHPGDRESIKKGVADALEGKSDYSIDHRIVLPSGEERFVHEEAEVTRDALGTPVRMLGTLHDLTDRKRAEDELKKLTMAIEQSINIIFITDIDGRIEYVNPKFEEVTGFTKEEAIGSNPNMLASGNTSETEYKNLWDTISSGKTWRGVFKNRKSNGDFYWSNGVITPIVDENGEITHFLSVQEDITDKKIAQERVDYLSSYDPLTGLINRPRFTELMTEWVESEHTKGSPATFILLDIDHFRPINDTYGHTSGDLIIRHTGSQIQNVINELDTAFEGKKLRDSIVGRLGADEFGILLPSRGEDEAMEAAEFIRKRLEGISVAEIPTRLTMSIGVVVYPGDGLSTKALLTKADAAIIRAKNFGGNRCNRYKPEDMDLEAMRSRLKDKELIQRALLEGRFEPWLQPIQTISSGEIHHYESLVRLRDASGEVFPPGLFLPTAEAFGLIGAIDRVMMTKTMKLQAEMRKTGKDVSFSMNLSGKDLEDVTMIDFIKETIVEVGADPEKIVFEITETAAIKEIEYAKNFIRALKEVGCKFSLDDFGVGFTSFLYLKELQVDYIKIDGYFIKDLHKNPEDQLFVKAIIDVARGMGIKTVAEFVEYPEVLELLAEYGVDYAQGYLIGKPEPWLQV